MAAVTCAAAGLLVFPIVLGPIGLVLGLTGQSHAHRLGGRREATTAVVLGLGNA